MVNPDQSAAGGPLSATVDLEDLGLASLIETMQSFRGGEVKTTTMAVCSA